MRVFDLDNLLERRRVQARRPLDISDFGGAAVQEVDPNNIERQRRGGRIGEGFGLIGGAKVEGEHNPGNKTGPFERAAREAFRPTHSAQTVLRQWCRTCAQSGNASPVFLLDAPEIANVRSCGGRNGAVRSHRGRKAGSTGRAASL
jgi:hypothetical protein